MSGGLMTDDINMNLSMNATEKQGRSVNNFLFSKKITMKSTCTKVIFKINYTKNVMFTSLRWRKKYYMDGLLFMMFDEEYLTDIINRWFFHIWNFNKENVIQHYNITISNITEEERYLTRMTPNGLINGKYESICSVNSSFQVHFFNIYLRHLILNIDCDKITEYLEDSEDELSSNFQKILILRVVQHIFCEFLIGGRKTVFTD